MLVMRNFRQLSEQRKIRQKNFNDAPLCVNVKQSIIDLRWIYSDMTDNQFARWYNKRYGITSQEVLKVLTDSKE